MDEIERLIALVDELDGNVDLEPEPVEASYAGFENVRADQDDAESDHDDREDVCEDEGAEHDGREPDVDGEPSLCGIHADSLKRFTTWMHQAGQQRRQNPSSRIARHYSYKRVV